MSHYLDELEMRAWMKFRMEEAARNRPEIFNEPRKDIQLSEIKSRLLPLVTMDGSCKCRACETIRPIIADIDQTLGKYK